MQPTRIGQPVGITPGLGRRRRRARGAPTWPSSLGRPDVDASGAIGASGGPTGSDEAGRERSRSCHADRPRHEPGAMFLIRRGSRSVGAPAGADGHREGREAGERVDDLPHGLRLLPMILALVWDHFGFHRAPAASRSVASEAPLMSRYRQFTERIFERIRSPPSGRGRFRSADGVGTSDEGLECRSGDSDDSRPKGR